MQTVTRNLKAGSQSDARPCVALIRETLTKILSSQSVDACRKRNAVEPFLCVVSLYKNPLQFWLEIFAFRESKALRHFMNRKRAGSQYLLLRR